MTLQKRYCAQVRTEYHTSCAKPVVKYSNYIEARTKGTWDSSNENFKTPQMELTD